MTSTADTALRGAARLWFVTAVIGQWFFLYYLLVFYGPSTLTGDFQAWTRNRLLFKGYVAGDTAGNLAFAAHALLAAVIAFGGALQIVPQIRARALAFHRWNGRVFLVTAVGLSLSGLYMANLQANLRSQVAFAVDTGRLLQSVNHLFCENSPEGAFASLFFADYHDATGALRYVNCGHLCALVLRRDGTLDRLAATSTVLGLFRQWECSVGESHLAPDDLLALYTDGVTEAFDDAGEEFGEERLVDALRRHGDRTPESLLSFLVDEVRSFSPHEQHDDLTLIVARRRGEARTATA